LEIQRRALGEAHPDTLLSANNLAALYRYQGKYAQAEALYTKAVDGRRRALGEQNPDTLVSRNDLAAMYESQGKYEQAEALFAEVLEARRRVLGPDHPVTSSTLASVGRVRLRQRKFAEAEPVLREALNGQEKKSPDGWPRFNSQSLLGGALAGEGEYGEAERLLLSGYEGLIQRESKIPWPLRSVLEQAGDRIVQLYQDWNKPGKAAEWRVRLRRP